MGELVDDGAGEVVPLVGLVEDGGVGGGDGLGGGFEEGFGVGDELDGPGPVVLGGELAEEVGEAAGVGDGLVEQPVGGAVL